MCSEYNVFTTSEQISEELGSYVLNSTGHVEWQNRIKFTNKAPVLLKNKDQKLELSEYIFPANPFPNSRLSGLEGKDADADEAQIRRIYEVPLWKNSFAHKPCLVPMTSFLEPVYWGDEAGTVQEFKPPQGKMFFVPGIVIAGRVPKTDKAFSLLTHTATAQMLKYHHRLLVLLKPQDAVEWFDFEKPEERFEFLIEKRWTPHLEVSKERNLAKGWEKRTSQHLGSLAQEKHYISTLKHEDVQA